LYDAFRMPLYLPFTSARSGGSLEVWGCVRPVHYVMLNSRTPQVASIQFKSSAGGRFHTIERLLITDQYGYFDTQTTFPGSGLVRIVWSYPHGAQIHSRTVQITIR
jgi:hypothetical protein